MNDHITEIDQDPLADRLPFDTGTLQSLDLGALLNQIGNRADMRIRCSRAYKEKIGHKRFVPQVDQDRIDGFAVLDGIP
jgi:hypothetical protein